MTSWFKASGLAALCAVGIVVPAGASSLAPVAVPALAGKWVLYPDGQPGQRCTLQLDAGGRAAGSPPTCAQAWLGQDVLGWASKPDGLALWGERHRTLVLLNPVGPGQYRGRTRQGLLLWLERP